MTCRYAISSSEAYVIDAKGERRMENPPRDLCGWALFHPAAPEKLVDTPPWLQRNAEAGHLMKLADCEHCPARENGPPVE